MAAESDEEDPKLPETPAAPVKRKVLSVTINNKAILYAAYMPFLKRGGLFIPTSKYFAMGEEIVLVVTLINNDLKYTVNGKVVWITPQDSHSNKAAGIGIEFSDDPEGESLRKRIEEILGLMLQSKDPTHTM
jgi:type IV pilus assembly protein PilZ